MSNNNQQSNNQSSGGCVIVAILIIGVLGILFFAVEGLEHAAKTFDNLPWYISLPLGGAIVFAIYYLGKEKNWW